MEFLRHDQRDAYYKAHFDGERPLPALHYYAYDHGDIEGMLHGEMAELDDDHDDVPTAIGDTAFEDVFAEMLGLEYGQDWEDAVLSGYLIGPAWHTIS